MEHRTVRWMTAAGLISALSIATATPSVAAEETDTSKNWQAGVTAYHSSGKYGTNATTSVTALMGSARALFEDGDVTLLVPYLSVTGDCAVTLLSGVPNRTGGTCPTRTVVNANGKTVTRTKNRQTTESGLGDVVLRGRYYVLDERSFWPTVAVVGQVKMPTADSDRGLGTGKFDERAGVETSKRLTHDLVTYLDGGYTVIGKPSGVSLRNQWYADAGLGYYWTEKLLASVYYEWWRSLTAGSQDPQDVLFALNYTTAAAIRLSASVGLGLSDGAPKTAVTGGLSVRF